MQCEFLSKSADRNESWNLTLWCRWWFTRSVWIHHGSFVAFLVNKSLLNVLNSCCLKVFFMPSISIVFHMQKVWVARAFLHLYTITCRAWERKNYPAIPVAHISLDKRSRRIWAAKQTRSMVSGTNFIMNYTEQCQKLAQKIISTFITRTLHKTLEQHNYVQCKRVKLLPWHKTPKLLWMVFPLGSTIAKIITISQRLWRMTVRYPKWLSKY